MVPEQPGFAESSDSPQTNQEEILRNHRTVRVQDFSECPVAGTPSHKVDVSGRRCPSIDPLFVEGIVQGTVTNHCRAVIERNEIEWDGMLRYSGIGHIENVSAFRAEFEADLIVFDGFPAVRPVRRRYGTGNQSR